MFSNLPFIASYTCFMDTISLFIPLKTPAIALPFSPCCIVLFLTNCFLYLFLFSMLSPSSSPHSYLKEDMRKLMESAMCRRGASSSVFTAEWSGWFHWASLEVRSLGVFSWAGQIPREDSSELLSGGQASGCRCFVLGAERRERRGCPKFRTFTPSVLSAGLCPLQPTGLLFHPLQTVTHTLPPCRAGVGSRWGNSGTLTTSATDFQALLLFLVSLPLPEVPGAGNYEACWGFWDINQVLLRFSQGC